jgi:hypothetical protein
LGNKNSTTEFYGKDSWLWEPDCYPLNDRIIGSADFVKYHGLTIVVNRVIPIQVFNNTSYSIIAETNLDNSLTFITEKTCKPLNARRLFVGFSGYKYLQNLRTFGFKTFGDIVDESYDLIEDGTKRWSAGLDQVRYLCSVEQEDILARVRETVDYNHDLVMNTDWTQYANNIIQQKIDGIINEQSIKQP